eukprot:6635137-Pyramimonas_sp.AAC.2
MPVSVCTVVVHRVQSEEVAIIIVGQQHYSRLFQQRRCAAAAAAVPVESSAIVAAAAGIKRAPSSTMFSDRPSHGGTVVEENREVYRAQGPALGSWGDRLPAA